MPDVRAQIIITARDEASAPLAKVGAAATKAGSDLNKGLSGAIKSATGLDLASVGAAAAVGALAAGLAYSIKQAAEAERVMAQTAAVIASTGGAAGLTAEQVGNYADKLSQLNAIDDETIQSAENILLTFKNVKAGAFEPATQAAIDLSVAFKMDLQSAIMMVGKALEDPIRGMTALRRAGVTFTTEQQDVIKALVATGQSAKAQEMILAELNSQMGGSAAAAAKTYSGQMALLKINMDNLAESIGMELLPVLTAATSAMNLLVTWNDKLENALAEHETEVVKTSGSYEEYVKEMVRARIASGEYVDATNWQAIVQGRAVAQSGLLTEAQYNQNRAVAEAVPQVQALDSAYFQMFGTAMEGIPIVNANTYALQEAGKAAALDAAMTGELTAAMIFQTAAAGENADAQLAIARGLGLVDEATLTAIGKVQSLKAKYDEGTISLANYVYQLGLIKNGIDGLNDKVVNVQVNVNTTQYGDENFGGWTPPVTNSGGGSSGGGGGTTTPPGDDPVYDGGMKGSSRGGSAALAQAINNMPAAVARAVRDGMQMAR